MRFVFTVFVMVVAMFLNPSALSGQRRPGLMGDLLANVTTVETRVIALAKAIPEPTYSWRPAEGIRSVSEALIHIAGENYFAAAKMGSAPPADTGIVGKTIKEARAYEERKMSRTQVIAALEDSFTLLKKSMADTPDERLDATIAFFGPTRLDTIRVAWIGTVTHLHEHLGQLIAYARSNKVAPPWSK
jgi:hypothetical protein